MEKAIIFITLWFISLGLINGFPAKFIFHRYKYSYDGFKVVPGIWINECLDTPGFKHQSIVIRIGLIYFGFQIKYNQ